MRAVARFQAFPGGGVGADDDGAAILVGTRRLLEEQHVGVSASAIDAIARLDETGQTSLLVARNGVLLGIIGARDRVCADAADVLQELRNAGIEQITMLTGDRASVARTVGEQLKIDDIRAEQLPNEKADLIAANHARTCYVGDGINDAPALSLRLSGDRCGPRYRAGRSVGRHCRSR